MQTRLFAFSTCPKLSKRNPKDLRIVGNSMESVPVSQQSRAATIPIGVTGLVFPNSEITLEYLGILPAGHPVFLICTSTSTSKHFPLCMFASAPTYPVLAWLYSSQVFAIDGHPKAPQEPRKDDFWRQSTSFSVSPMHPYIKYFPCWLPIPTWRKHKNSDLTDLPLEHVKLFRRKFERSPSTMVQTGCMVVLKPREAPPNEKTQRSADEDERVNMPLIVPWDDQTSSAAYQNQRMAQGDIAGINACSRPLGPPTFGVSWHIVPTHQRQDLARFCMICLVFLCLGCKVHVSLVGCRKLTYWEMFLNACLP